MSEEKDRDQVERALKRVEELDDELASGVGVDAAEIEVLNPGDGPPSGDPSGEGQTMSVADDVDDDLKSALAEAAQLADGDDDGDDDDDDDDDAMLADDEDGDEEELVIEDEPPKKNPQDAILQAMIAAKNEALEALGHTQHEAKSMHDRLTRVSANFENFKKRATREKDDAVRFANEKLLKELLPVIDNMERAIDVARKATENSESEVVASVVQGVELVHKSFSDTFAKFGVVSFTAVGEQFDPAVHEAVAQREETSVPHNSVLEEYQRGYKLHGRLVRPAMVIVASGGPPAEKAKAADSDGTSGDDNSGDDNSGDDNSGDDNKEQDASADGDASDTAANDEKSAPAGNGESDSAE